MVTLGEAAEVETCKGKFIYFVCVNVNDYKETLRELQDSSRDKEQVGLL